jgi:hypothetical protein
MIKFPQEILEKEDTLVKVSPFRGLVGGNLRKVPLLCDKKCYKISLALNDPIA